MEKLILDTVKPPMFHPKLEYARQISQMLMGSVEAACQSLFWQSYGCLMMPRKRKLSQLL